VLRIKDSQSIMAGDRSRDRACIRLSGFRSVPATQLVEVTRVVKVTQLVLAPTIEGNATDSGSADYGGYQHRSENGGSPGRG